MEAFYNTAWYEESSVKMRKSMILVMSLLQRESEIKMFGMYRYDLKLFIRTLKVIYSVVNLLIVMKKKIILDI